MEKNHIVSNPPTKNDRPTIYFEVLQVTSFFLSYVYYVICTLQGGIHVRYWINHKGHLLFFRPFIIRHHVYNCYGK